MNRLSSTLGVIALGGLVAACGGLAGDTKSYPALATLKGQLTNTQSIQTVTDKTPTGDVRVAVVWVGEVASSYNIAVDVPVKPVFPSEFEISLTSAPPDSTIATNKNAQSSSTAVVDPNAPNGVAPSGSSSGGSAGTGTGGGGGAGGVPSGFGPSMGANVRMQSFEQKNWPDGFGVAIGAVVAYQDLNGNGKLDLVDPGATQYVDRILGANDSLLLVYVQGEVPQVIDFMDDAGKLPTRGYNIFRFQSCSTPLGSSSSGGSNGSGYGSSCKSTMTWLSMDTLYELPLSSDPHFSQLMCKTQSGFDSVSAGSSGDTGNVSAGGSTSTSGGSGGPIPVQVDAGAAPDLDGGSADSSATDGGPAPDGGTTDASVGPANPSYPAADDPNLHCMADGKSYFYADCSTQNPTPVSPPQPTGLCGPTNVAFTDTPSACGGPVVYMPTPEPSNWPCPVAK